MLKREERNVLLFGVSDHILFLKSVEEYWHKGKKAHSSCLIRSVNDLRQITFLLGMAVF